MQGKSDCRTLSAEHTQEQLEHVVRSLRKAGTNLGCDLTIGQTKFAYYLAMQRWQGLG